MYDSAISPEVMQAHMQKWQDWMRQLSQEGKMKAGLPLTIDGKVLRSSSVVTDGPFAEGKEIIGGYLIVQAADLAEATEIAKSCPIFLYEGSVEVRKIAPMSM